MVFRFSFNYHKNTIIRWSNSYFRGRFGSLLDNLCIAILSKIVRRSYCPFANKSGQNIPLCHTLCHPPIFCPLQFRHYYYSQWNMSVETHCTPSSRGWVYAVAPSPEDDFSVMGEAKSGFLSLQQGGHCGGRKGGCRGQRVESGLREEDMRHTIGMSFTDEDTRNCVMPCNERVNDSNRIRGDGHNEERVGRFERGRNGWQWSN